MERRNSHQLTVICLFAVLFMLIGVYAPVVYATYMPQGQIISVNEFQAEDVTTGDDTHYLCWNRTMQNDRAVSVQSELLLLSEDGRTIEVDQQSSQQVFEEGQQSLLIEMDLPNDLVAGEYRYRFIVSIEMANGRVERNLFIDSKPFTVSDAETKRQLSC